MDLVDKRDMTADVGIARRRLDDARSKLDAAVAALPDAGGDEAMATPALLSLLLGAVTAKDRLKELEALLLMTGTTGKTGKTGKTGSTRPIHG